MRILHVADLHLRWFDWVRSRARDFDLLVVAGDLQDGFANIGMVDQARRCTDWLLSLETPTVVVSGNHDYYVQSPHVKEDDPTAEARWLRRLSGQARILATDRQTVLLQHGSPIRITAVGWAQKLRWPKDTAILVYHAPPCDTDVAYEAHSSTDQGDSDFWLQLLNNPAPRLILSGHVHFPRQYWSRWPVKDANAKSTVLIPGCDLGAEEPNRWEIDFDRGRAIWTGDGEQVISF